MKHLSHLPIYLIICLFLPPQFLNSQEVISSGGGTQSNSIGSISHTIGEPISGLKSNTQGSLSQGYQQSNYVVTALSELPNRDLLLDAYPNPVIDRISIEIKLQNEITLVGVVSDMNGSEILKQPLYNGLNNLDLSNLPAGNYIIVVLEENKILKSFKLVKH